MTTAQLKQLISLKRPALEFLYQKFQIWDAVTAESLQAACKKFGASFISEFSKILSSPATAGDRLGVMPSSAAPYIDPGTWGAGEGSSDGGSTSSGGAWDFLSDALNTGYKIYLDAKGNPTTIPPTPAPAPEPAKVAGLSVNTLIYAGIGLAVIVLIIVLIRKK